jgi:hypothetical protein
LTQNYPKSILFLNVFQHNSLFKKTAVSAVMKFPSAPSRPTTRRHSIPTLPKHHQNTSSSDFPNNNYSQPAPQIINYSRNSPPLSVSMQNSRSRKHASPSPQSSIHSRTTSPKSNLTVMKEIDDLFIDSHRNSSKIRFPKEVHRNNSYIPPLPLSSPQKDKSQHNSNLEFSNKFKADSSLYHHGLRSSSEKSSLRSSNRSSVSHDINSPFVSFYFILIFVCLQTL